MHITPIIALGIDFLATLVTQLAIVCMKLGHLSKENVSATGSLT